MLTYHDNVLITSGVTSETPNSFCVQQKSHQASEEYALLLKNFGSIGNEGVNGKVEKSSSQTPKGEI